MRDRLGFQEIFISMMLGNSLNPVNQEIAESQLSQLSIFLKDKKNCGNIVWLPGKPFFVQHLVSYVALNLGCISALCYL